MPLRAAKGKGKKQTGAKRRKVIVTEQRAAAEPKGPRGRPTNAERQWRAAATNGLPGAIDEASDLAAAGPSTGTHPRRLASAPTRFNDESELESPIKSDSDSNISDAEVDAELNSNGDGSEDEEDAALAATLAEAAAALRSAQV